MARRKGVLAANLVTALTRLYREGGLTVEGTRSLLCDFDDYHRGLSEKSLHDRTEYVFNVFHRYYLGRNVLTGPIVAHDDIGLQLHVDWIGHRGSWTALSPLHNVLCIDGYGGVRRAVIVLEVTENHAYHAVLVLCRENIQPQTEFVHVVTGSREYRPDRLLNGINFLMRKFLTEGDDKFIDGGSEAA